MHGDNERSSDALVEKVSQQAYKQSILNSLNLKIVEIPGDGNCQYSSISHFVFGGDVRQQMVVRERIHQELTEHPEHYVESFADNTDGEEATFLALLNNVIMPGTYGNNITLFAASNAFEFDYGIICNDHVILSEERYIRRFYFVFDGTGVRFDGHYSATSLSES